MPSWEIPFKWTLTGEDTAIVRAATKKEALKKFREKFESFNEDEVLPEAIFIEPIEGAIIQWGFERNNNSDDYEIIV